MVSCALTGEQHHVVLHEFGRRVPERGRTGMGAAGEVFGAAPPPPRTGMIPPRPPPHRARALKDVNATFARLRRRRIRSRRRRCGAANTRACRRRPSRSRCSGYRLPCDCAEGSTSCRACACLAHGATLGIVSCLRHFPIWITSGMLAPSGASMILNSPAGSVSAEATALPVYDGVALVTRSTELDRRDRLRWGCRPRRCRAGFSRRGRTRAR